MQKIISLLLLIILVNAIIQTDTEASVIRGKRYYIKLLKEHCGFKGDVMGKYHSKKEWRDMYRNGVLNIEIKKICPTAPNIASEKKLKHLYNFFSSFANDSGNVPSCN